MPAWGTIPIDRRSRLSVAAMLAVSGMVFGLLLWDASAGSHVSRRADALGSAVLYAAQSKDTTFPEPRDINWTGTITRIFLSGEALEVVGEGIPGGVFQAYLTDNQTPVVTSGRVRIMGQWRGMTCAYGGHNDECVPDVEIISITQAQ